MGRLEGKIAIITGAARGMGAAMAELFVGEGAAVLLTDVRDKEGQEHATSLGSAARYLHMDVTKREDWQRALATVEFEFGAPNVLVNNAGVLSSRTIFDTTPEQFHKILDINLVGPFLGIQVVGQAMADRRSGAIVNVSSTAAIIGYSVMPAYVASKFGLRGLSKGAAIELGHSGIRVNCIEPGGVDTPMVNLTGGPPQDESAARQPIPRMGRPVEIAEMALFLASDESSYCTGADFVVDGGATAGVDVRDMVPPGDSDER